MTERLNKNTLKPLLQYLKETPFISSNISEVLAHFKIIVTDGPVVRNLSAKAGDTGVQSTVQEDSTWAN